MIKLYILLHIATFMAGCFDNGNITVFMMFVLIDICVLLDKLFGASNMMDRICDYIRK